MLNERLVNLINYQINKELESAYLYMDFANYFNEKGLTGFGHWYKIQAQEEIEHAEKFIDYLQDENAKVRLMAIEKIECKCTDNLDVLKNGLKHEEYVTKLINELYVEAEKLYDYRTLRFLDWYINEQAEEEKNAHDLINRYELFVAGCGNGSDCCGAGLYQLDKELSNR